MVQMFRSESKLDEIEKFYEAKDLKNYRILVHSVKSTALSIGAVPLSEQAKALENAAKSDDEKYIEENHHRFAEAYKEITEKIGAAFGMGGEDKNADEKADEDKNTNILVVDDNPMNLRVAQSLLGKKYTINTAASGEDAMKLLSEDGNHTDLILLDIHMQDEDGFDVIKKLKADSKLSERQTKYAEERKERMERLSRETVLSLAKAVEAKDKYTNGHSERVAHYARLIAEKAGMSETEQDDIYIIGLLHDIGKIGIPDTVLNKTSKLTDEEFAVIKTHTTIGAEILKNITEMPGIEQGARWHHERYDGNGYPDGIKGDEIPEFARIICVADAYDAMTSTRSYRDILPQEKVRAELVRCSGTQFDPKFADIMVQLIDDDPDYKMKG